MLRPHNHAAHIPTTEESTTKKPLIAQETSQGHYGSKKLISLTTKDSNEQAQETMQGHCGSKKLVA